VIPVLAALMALACAAASARRMWFAANPTALHPEEVRALLRRGRAALSELSGAAEEEPGADWERELLRALSAPGPELRAALVNEQLTELDHRLQRWSRVPRVCASIATSFAFLLATLVLRRGLADARELEGEVAELVTRGLIGEALTVAALGMVGTAFCIGAHVHARRLAKERIVAADKMVEALERVVVEGLEGAPSGPSED
jgi:hypothetical protein